MTWHLPRSYDEASLAGVERVDVVISPCVNQNLSAFPLVLGNDNIARLCGRLRPRVLVPLTNAEFEAEGARAFCAFPTAPCGCRFCWGVPMHPVLAVSSCSLHMANFHAGPASSFVRPFIKRRALFLHRVKTLFELD